MCMCMCFIRSSKLVLTYQMVIVETSVGTKIAALTKLRANQPFMNIL